MSLQLTVFYLEGLACWPTRFLSYPYIPFTTYLQLGSLLLGLSEPLNARVVTSLQPAGGYVLSGGSFASNPFWKRRIQRVQKQSWLYWFVSRLGIASEYRSWPLVARLRKVLLLLSYLYLLCLMALDEGNKQTENKLKNISVPLIILLYFMHYTDFPLF